MESKPLRSSTHILIRIVFSVFSKPNFWPTALFLPNWRQVRQRWRITLLSLLFLGFASPLLAQTTLVKDINPGSASSSPFSLVVMGGTLYFITVVDVSGGCELWKTDGTSAGTVRITNIGINANELTVVGNTLYFWAYETTNGQELWKSDGTAAGTVLVKNIRPGSASSNPRQLTVVGTTLYFTANDGTHGEELWISDGTEAGTVMIKDIYPGGTFSSSYPSYLKAMGNTLYFSALDTNGEELWKSDGTAAGTVMVKDIHPGGANTGSDPRDFTLMGGIVYFRANDGTNGYELWKSDGTATGTVMVKDIYPGSPASNSYPSDFVVMGNTLYFNADGGNGQELWKSDGTEAGTTMVKDIRPGYIGSAPFNLTTMGSYFYFSADDGTHGKELWRSDGTEAGTTMVKDIRPGGATSNSTPYSLTVIGSRLYFFADNGTNGTELWQTDGTEAGTVMVADINPGSAPSRPSYLTVMDGNLYFQADDGTNGIELWKSIPSKSLTIGTAISPTNCTPPNGSIAFTSMGFASSTQTLNYSKDGTATSASVTIAADGSFTLSGLEGGVYTDFIIGTTTATGTNPTLTPPTLPTITLGTINSVSNTATTFSIPYTATTGNPNQYSLTTGTPAMSGFTTVNNATLGTSPISVTIPASAVNTYNFNLTVRNSSTGCVSTAQTVALAVTEPTITITLGSGGLTSFLDCVGTTTPSVERYFGVRGSSLTSNIIVTAPTGFEVSRDGFVYGPSVTLTPSGGGIVPPTNIKVRIKTTAAGTPSGNVTCESAGATTQNVAVSGTVNALPTITLGTVAGVSTTATSFDIPYTATTGSPNQYSLTAGTPAMSGFTNITNANLPTTSPITVTIPASAANTYNFSLTVRNSTTGCVSTAQTVALTTAVPATITKMVLGFRSGTYVAVKSDGTLWSIAGQCPTQIGTESNWVDVAAGEGHLLALKSNGTLWASGENTYGQLGLGDNTNRNTLTQVGSATDWKSVATGRFYSFAIKTNGTLWAWGQNGFSNLGLGDFTDRTTPTRVGTATDWKAVDGGEGFTLALKTNGTLWAWGSNSFGQLGINSSTGTSQPTPIQVGTGNTWSAIATGSGHALALQTNGTLWAWGLNYNGQLGLGNSGTGTHRISPQRVGTETNWKEISVYAGGQSSLALKTNNTLFAWGQNDSGQLGIGNTTNQNTPQQIAGTNWATATAGSSIGYALKTDNTLWRWGSYIGSSPVQVGCFLPTITSFFPTAVCEGANVTITGTKFTGASAVRIGGVEVSSFTINSDTQITATVAVGTTTGTVSVTNSDGTGESTGSLTVNALPTINPGPITPVSTTATSFIIPSTNVTGTPNQFSLTAGTPAMLGFTAITNGSLSSSSTIVPIPASAAGTYNFNLTVRNSTTGCVSAAIPVALTVVACPSGNTLYVNASVSGGTGDGTSWANAYASLSDALAKAHTCSSIDTIKVAAGTYKPTKKPFNAGTEMTTADGRDVTFHIPDGVTIKGGYNATGNRDIDVNFTALSGDLDNNNLVDDGNAYHVVLASAASSGGVGVTIDGFFIVLGNANGSNSITVNGNIFPSSYGGGIATYYGTNTISNNTVNGNEANSAGAAGGAGIATFYGTNTLSNNILSANFSGGLSDGGGIYTSNGTNTLSNNTLFLNSAAVGGGINTNSGTNTLSNNTLYNNSADQYGGGIYTNNGTNTLTNNIFWGNKKGTDATVAGADYYAGGTNGNTFKNNLLQRAISNYPVSATGIYAIGTAATGNIFNQDPLFVSTTNFLGADGKRRTADDGLALQSSSPCVNAGISGVGIPTKDITGATRVGNTDIGAYESLCTPPTVYAVTGGGAYCSGGTGVAVGLANSETGVTYQLKKDGVNDGTAVAGTGMTLSFGNKTLAGTYTVEATKTSNNCKITMPSTAVVSINPLPSINPGPITPVSNTATSFIIPSINVSGTPNQFSLTAGTPAMLGFTAITNGSLSSSSTIVPIPASAAGTYNFNLTVRNSTTGCVSAVVPVALTVTEPPRPFITRWDLSKPGPVNTNSLSFGVFTRGIVSYTWQRVDGTAGSGSGTFSGTTANITGLPVNAIIDLSIAPTNFLLFNMDNGINREQLTEIRQWGDVAWVSMTTAFLGCSNMTLTATDVPNLAGVTDMRSMFNRCTSFNQALPEGFNTSNITNMGSMFQDCSAYNKALPSSFNTSAVVDMSQMFQGCTAYNQALPSGFDTKNVTDMGSMFQRCTAFNQSLASFTLNANVNLTNFLNNCGMSVANYDATLTAFNAQNVTGRTMGALGLKYCAAAADRANLVLPVASGGKGWTITYDGLLCPPSITTTGTPPFFSTCANTASAQESFIVSGTNLIADITITAPTGFEVSTTSGSGFGSSVTIPLSGTSVTSTVFVRMAAAASGSTHGPVTCASTGATTQNVFVTGTVNPAPTTPTVQSNFSILVGSLTSLNATGCTGTGSLLRWYRSSDNAEVFPPVAPSSTTSFYSKCEIPSNGITCTSANSSTLTVTVLNSPVPVATGATICNGSNTTLTATGCSGSTGTYTLKWYQQSNNSLVTMPLSPTSTTAYYAVCEQTFNGTTATSGSSNVVNVAVLNPAVPVATGATISIGSSVTLTATGCSGSVGTFALIWYKTSDNSVVTMPVSPTAATQYYAKCSVTSNGTTCMSAKSADVSVLVRGRIYVNVANNAPTQDGTTWATAFSKLQDALTVAAASALPRPEVWIAKGEYKPTQNTDRTISFDISSDTKLYGGFVGNETSLNQRNPKTNETLLSGDIGAIGTFTDNSYHVVTILNGNSSTLIDGMSIKYGYAANQPPVPFFHFDPLAPPVTPVLPEQGGGIYIQGGSPTISNCVVQWNNGIFGAGIYTENNSLAKIQFCNISGNVATFGGGIYNLNSNTVVNNALIVGNKAFGGGMYNNNSNPVLTNVTIADNGGSIGLFNTVNVGQVSIPVITNSIIWNSSINSTPTITYSIVQGGFVGTGNLNADPMFVSPQPSTNAPITTGDYHVKVGSPSIDMGNNGTTTLTDIDLDGNLRRYNGGAVDIGAYEFQGGISSATLISVKTGNWESADTWNLNRVPTAPDNVIIDTNHNVTITTDNANAKQVQVRGNGKVIHNSNTTKLKLGF